MTRGVGFDASGNLTICPKIGVGTKQFLVKTFIEWSSYLRY